MRYIVYAWAIFGMAVLLFKLWVNSLNIFDKSVLTGYLIVSLVGLVVRKMEEKN